MTEQHLDTLHFGETHQALDLHAILVELLGKLSIDKDEFIARYRDYFALRYPDSHPNKRYQATSAMISAMRREQLADTLFHDALLTLGCKAELKILLPAKTPPKKSYPDIWDENIDILDSIKTTDVKKLHEFEIFQIGELIEHKDSQLVSVLGVDGVLRVEKALQEKDLHLGTNTGNWIANN